MICFLRGGYSFLTPPVFDIATNLFLASLSEQGQDITYLTTARKGGAFVATNDVWGAPWRSSFRECVPGSSTFVPQVVEADWKSEDILHGPMKSATTDRVIANCQRRMKLRFNDETYNFIYHKPSGAHLHQGSLIRGHGLWEPQGCVHDKGFRRFTSMQLEALLARNVDFMIHRGVMSPFTETWVFVSHANVPFNEIEIDQYLNLTFARTREEALRHFPRHNGALSLGLLRRMFSDYIIVGELPTAEVWDISRTGMIRNVSEFKEFLFSQNIGSLGSLGGTPAARALERAAAQATTKAKAKASAATKRRDAYVTAFNSMYAAPPRAQSVDNVAEEAFGNSDLAAADEVEDGDVDASADAHDDAAEDADKGSL